MLNKRAAIENSKNVRILDEQLEWITKIYESRPYGINRLLCYAENQMQIARGELKGVFTRAELSAMVDNENGVLIDKRYWGNKRMFLHALEDGVNLDGLAEKWGVDYDTMKEKIMGIPDSTFLYLHEQIYVFWNERRAYGSPAPSLDKFVDVFCDD